MAITGIASLTYALIEANARGWTSPLILALFAVSAATLTAFQGGVFVRRPAPASVVETPSAVTAPAATVRDTV